MPNKRLFALSLLVASVSMGNQHRVQAAPFEVLHWWTEKGELESKQVLVEHLKAKHIEFEDFAIVGEGGDGAIHVLQMRALSGTPPEAAQIKGPDIAEWDRLSMLVSIDQLTDSSSWKQFFPQVVIDDVLVAKQYMGVPINIHRVNWLWLNTKIFEQYSLTPPQTWQQFFTVADNLSAKGIKPVALGGTPWQDALLFEAVAISQLGSEKYKQAFVEFDTEIIASTEMVQTFEVFKKLHRYATKEQQGKDWTWSAQQFINGQAAMLLMGDWVKGSWTTSGKTAIEDFQCVPTPGTQGIFSFNIDSFVLFKKDNSPTQQQIQSQFVETLLSPKFQHDFSLSKGSIPARNDVDLSDFDECSLKSSNDFKSGVKVPSLTQNMATSSHQQGQIIQLISDFFNSKSMTSQQAVDQLVVMVKALTSK